MKAFVEILSGVVRVGPDCDKYGKPYEFAVAFSSADGRHAVIKALVANGTFKMSYAKEIIRALNKIGLVPIWERKK